MIVKEIELIPHQLHPDPLEIRSRISRQKNVLTLNYKLEGVLEYLILPQQSLSQSFTNELWKNTCFEAFLQIPGQHHYCELNFSPSGNYAAYEFESYRTGMKPLTHLRPPHVQISKSPHVLEFAVSLDLPEPWATAPILTAAITSVIEERNRGISYWAIRHKLGRPDFHDSTGFVVSLKSA